MRLVFDLDVLRTFIVGIELGSFAKAADRLGRSTSAVSAQMKKLEEQVGVPIMRKSGRGLMLTPTGETMLTYAHRLLELNNEAATAVRSIHPNSCVRIGLQEDFSEDLLTEILGEFYRAYPQVRIEATVARNAELLDLIRSGRLDLALAWDSGKITPHYDFLGNLSLCWIGAGDSETAGNSLPLLVFDAPCLMRCTAITTLDQAHIPWHIAFTSPSLGGIWAAVGAGLGVTVRTRAGMPKHLCVLDNLPQLPNIGVVLHRAEVVPAEEIQKLSEIILTSLSDLLAQ